jgi:DNA-binding transcriptional ArsR family regulator
MNDSDLDRMAHSLAALGNPIRLGLFRRLVRAGRPGVNFGKLAADLQMPPSSLAHHLHSLVSTGLVLQEKAGRETLNTANFKAVEELTSGLLRHCCADEPAAQAEPGND